MDFKFFYKSLIGIIFTPVKTWEIISDSNTTNKFLRNNFMFPLLIIIALAAFFGSLFFSSVKLSPVYSVITSVKYFFLFLLLVYSSALILGEITRPLDLGKNFTISFRLMLFSLTPFFLCQVISLLFESLIFVNVIALFGMYIFWAGAEKMLNPPDYKKMPLLIATFTVVAGLFFAGDWLLTTISDRIYFSFFV